MSNEPGFDAAVASVGSPNAAVQPGDSPIPTTDGKVVADRSLVSEAIFLAAVPALGYAAAYAHEFSYCGTLGLPTGFIELGLPQVIAASALLAFLVFMLLQPLTLVGLAAQRLRLGGAVLAPAIRVVGFAVITVICLVTVKERLWAALIFGLPTILFIVGDFLVPALRPCSAHSHPGERITAAHEGGSSQDPRARASGTRISVGIIAALGMVALSLASGSLAAKLKRRALVYREEGKTWAVLATYGSRSIAAPIVLTTGAVQSTQIHVLTSAMLAGKKLSNEFVPKGGLSEASPPF